MIDHHESVSPSPAPPPAVRFSVRAAIWFAGVILPVIAVAALLIGVFWAQMIHLLTLSAHLFLIASVPLANAQLMIALKSGQPALSRPLALLHGFAIGISAFFTVLFLPVTLGGVAMIIYFGIGLLMLAPLLSLVATLAARRLLGRRLLETGGAPLPSAWPGALLALAIVGAMELPTAVTRLGMRMATDEAHATSANGIRLLRYLGNEDIMLRLCYGDGNVGLDLISSMLMKGPGTSAEDARAVYYRLTGTPFSDVANLHLASSRIDGTLDARAALGSLEWTMVLRKEKYHWKEAHAQVTLPAGAVVTRVTMRDDSGEHEATVAGGARSRAEQEEIAWSKRPPILVTTAGKDRIMLALRPDQKGSELTLRIAMTAPLVLNEARLGYLQLPAFSEHNFEIPPALRHAVSVESASALQGAPGMREETGATLPFAVRGDIAEPVPGVGAAIISALRAPDDTQAWSPDPTVQNGAIVQTISQKAARIPRRVALVIDGSMALAAQREQLARAATSFPGNVELGVIVAGNEAPQVFLHDHSDSLASVRHLQDIAYEGGHDNSAALLMAWEWAAASSDGAVVWIHGPQPIMPRSANALLQHYRQRPDQVRMFALEAVTGPNVLWERMEGIAALSRVPRIGSLHDDLVRLLSGWKPGAQQIVAERRRRTERQPAQEQTSPHLTHLWAGERAALLRAKNALATPQEEEQLRGLEQLPLEKTDTPVPGAQPQAVTGRKAAQAAGMGIVPEPETVLITVVALAVLGWRMRFHLRTPYPASPE
ncbi:VWA domain-containing protein [Massilia sp. CCM 9210]|uniref:vWA domain-containing protein n=1 Tax=Massilia scottii TaxID=3057166 RepID=UPI0027968588|nr:vWA domain-containing protein [Massilia sp. CCM 9210]MDQ1817155.1 VWA domain-containing protein [Massilia sp. CCM 9210]